MKKVKTKRKVKEEQENIILDSDELEAEVKWNAVPWKEIEKAIFKLQKKIYKGLMRIMTIAKCGNTRKRY